MNELPAAENWLHDKLASDGEITSVVGGRIYKYALPQSPIYPLVIYSLASDSDFQGLGTVRILARPLYLVKVISRGSPSSLVNLAADRIDEIVGKTTKDSFISTAGDMFAVSSRREAAVQFMERDPTVAGTLYFHLGGLYRLEVFSLGRKVVEMGDSVNLNDAVNVV
ncbi:MAG TPA: hypothetical protein VL866_24030 [Pyrinomonadaceae bacterium]|nr:hypothetical protein [Pyrinomonadaceae bacterium]